MLLNYKFGSDDLYVPIALNLLVRSEYFNRNESEVVDLRLINELVEWLPRITGECSHVLLDFQAIKTSGSRIFKHLKPFFQGGFPFKVICCNLNEKLSDYIITECDGLPIFDSKLKAISTKSGLEYYSSQYAGDLNFTVAVTGWLKERLKEECIPKVTFLNSSNLWSNKYISIKKLFGDPHSAYLMISAIAELARKNFFDEKDPKADALICSSNNGAILASAVGQMLEIDVVYLMNLGPRLAPKDSHFIDHIVPGTRYVYIGDMICLGAEYRVAKTVVRACQADVVGGVVVAKYLDPQPDPKSGKSSKGSIFSPVTIDDGFNYELTVKKPVGSENHEGV